MNDRWAGYGQASALAGLRMLHEILTQSTTTKHKVHPPAPLHPAQPAHLHHTQTRLLQKHRCIKAHTCAHTTTQGQLGVVEGLIDGIEAYFKQAYKPVTASTHRHTQTHTGTHRHEYARIRM